MTNRNMLVLKQGKHLANSSIISNTFYPSIKTFIDINQLSFFKLPILCVEMQAWGLRRRLLKVLATSVKSWSLLPRTMLGVSQLHLTSAVLIWPLRYLYTCVHNEIHTYTEVNNEVILKKKCREKNQVGDLGQKQSSCLAFIRLWVQVQVQGENNLGISKPLFLKCEIPQIMKFLCKLFYKLIV